jgi:hypothetical protein
VVLMKGLNQVVMLESSRQVISGETRVNDDWPTLVREEHPVRYFLIS